MKKETMIWTVVFVIGLALLGVRAMQTGGLFGTAYVKVTELNYVEIPVDGGDPIWVERNSEAALDHDLSLATNQLSWNRREQSTPAAYKNAMDADENQTMYAFSFWRTVGIWISAFFTLAIFSFLYKDNPFYKIAESVVVGVSAAYWMVVGFWNVLIPNLFGMIEPNLVSGWAMPGLQGATNHWAFLIPLVLGIMLLMRLSPKGGWISRWPLAFIIGTTAGIRLLGFFHGDFITQISSSIMPIVVTENDGIDVVWDSLRNIIVVIGVLSCLVYFFFSFEHKGIVGQTAKLGIWFLMITFGAAFGFTVMGRIALLAIRLEFLFDDWLWLIDPTGKRVAEVAGMLMANVSMIT